MFRQTTIVGVGLIGGSLAIDLRQAGLCSQIVGVGRSPTNIETALSRGIIDRATGNLAEGVGGSDLVVLATPVETLARQIREVAPHLAADALMVDAGSVKAPLVEAGAELMRQGRFVPCHPIAGTEKGGAAHAFAGLFRGARCILTPTPDTPAQAVEKAAYLWERVGMKIHRMDAAEHDQIFARVSHLPHVAAYAMVHYLQGLPEWEKSQGYAGGGYRDFTRIAASPPEMWVDILKLNHEPVLECARGYAEAMRQVVELIEKKDYAALHAIFDNARRTREGSERKA